MVDVIALFDEIRDDDAILEDRREYDAEMLATMYGLTAQEADDLYWLIQDLFDPNTPIPLDRCSPDLLREALVEAAHSDLDGWDNPHDKVVIYRFLTDMRRYVSNV